MRRFLCCVKGKGSSAEPDEEVVDPFGDNHLLNYAFRYKLDVPDDGNLPESGSNPAPSSPPLLSLPVFTFDWNEILVATGNLETARFLGEGNFGQVHRCDFPNNVGAAKIQSLDVPYGHDEFAAEIRALYRANHPNVIKLLGKAFGPNRRGLVYEFMPKGSLDRYLFAAVGSGLSLDWKRRMKIAVGIAEALVYLHTALKVLHLDVKIGNVLLDQDFTPKLTDFGLSTKMAHDNDGEEMQSVVDPIKGTPGCIAPETQEFGFVSTKSDVYSYGVFLLQLFTGRKSFDRDRPLERRKLADWLMPVWSNEQNVAMIIDFKLGGRFPVEGMNRVFQAARMCINPQVLARPDMAFVESMVRDAAAFEIPELVPIENRRSI